MSGRLIFEHAVLRSVTPATVEEHSRVASPEKTYASQETGYKHVQALAGSCTITAGHEIKGLASDTRKGYRRTK